MYQNIKKIFFWGLGCAARGVFLFLPVLYAAGLLFDILTMAAWYYPKNGAVYIFKISGEVFLAACLWCILLPLGKLNFTVFFVSWSIFAGMLLYNPDIKRIYQYSQCIEVSSVSCPDGIVLGGG